MVSRIKALLAGGVLILGTFPAMAGPRPDASKRIDLAKLFAGGKLRAVNRDIIALPDRQDGVHVSERADPGLVWIDGLEFTDGSLEVDVRGRDKFSAEFPWNCLSWKGRQGV